MKAGRVIVVVSAVLVLGAQAPARGGERTFWGALIGAGAGLALGEAVPGIDNAISVPALAIVGGVVGHELERANSRARRAERAAHRSYRRPATADRHAATTVKRGRRATDYHPGVSIVKIPVRMANGVEIDLRLVRVGDSFVGPRGEVYKELPTAADLAQRYVP